MNFLCLSIDRSIICVPVPSAVSFPRFLIVSSYVLVVISLRDPQQCEDVLCFHQLRAGAEVDRWTGGILHFSFI